MTVTTTTIKQRLSTRAKAFASDPDLVTDSVLTLAVDEAVELAGITTPMPVLVDIAFYRVLLQMGRDIDEGEQKAYRTALNQISDPLAPSAPARVTAVAKAKSRPNPYQ